MSVPLVISRRFDQLGARLSALTDAMAVATVYGYDFAFVWAESLDKSINDAHQLFSDEFLAAHRIVESDLEGRTIISGDDLPSTLAAMQELQASHEDLDLVLEIDNPFGVWVDRDDQAVTARPEFIESFLAIGWSEPVASVIESCSSLSLAEPRTAIHLRAGDIVTGGWRHLVAHEKYTPTPFVLAALERSIAEDATTLVMSDHRELLDWIRSTFPTVVTPDEVIPSYSSLSELQQAFADLYLMSRCSRIECPPRSAFSGFAALLGGGTVHRLDQVGGLDDEQRILRDGIDALEPACARFAFLSPLVARDICWYLDTFSDQITDDEALALARRAVACDGDFAGGRSRLGRVLAIQGHADLAERQLELALELARSTDRHTDPELEAQASMILLEAVASITTPSSWRAAATPRAPRIHELHASCRDRPPYQLNYADILVAIEFIEAFVSWFESLSPRWQRTIAKTARGIPVSAIDMARYRAPGLDLHRGTSPLFDPVARDLDRVVVWLSTVVSTSSLFTKRFSGDGTQLRSSMSPSGLTWARGTSSSATRGMVRLWFRDDVADRRSSGPRWVSLASPSDANFAVPIERVTSEEALDANRTGVSVLVSQRWHR